MPVTITHAKSDTIADFTGTITIYNSSGGTTTAQATNLVRPSDWNSNHVATLSVAGSEMYSNGFYEPYFPQNTNSTLSAPGVGTWYLDHFCVRNQLGSGQLNFLAADAAGFLNGAVISAVTTGSVTRYQTLSSKYCIYQPGTGANTTRIETVYSNQISVMATWERRVTTGATNSISISNYLTLSFPHQYDASGGVTYSSTAQSGTLSVGASTMVSSSMNSLISGAVAYMSGSKYVVMPFATQLPAGDYYMAFMISNTSSSTGTNYSNGTMFSTQSVMGNLEFVHQAYKFIGESVSNSSTCIPPFHGSVATTSTSPITSLGTSDMRNFVTNHRRYWNYVQSTY